MIFQDIIDKAREAIKNTPCDSASPEYLDVPIMLPFDLMPESFTEFKNHNVPIVHFKKNKWVGADGVMYYSWTVLGIT